MEFDKELGIKLLCNSVINSEIRNAKFQVTFGSNVESIENFQNVKLILIYLWRSFQDCITIVAFPVIWIHFL